jgi:hypothetical protein
MLVLNRGEWSASYSSYFTPDTTQEAPYAPDSSWTVKRSLPCWEENPDFPLIQPTVPSLYMGGERRRRSRRRRRRRRRKRRQRRTISGIHCLLYSFYLIWYTQ